MPGSVRAHEYDLVVRDTRQGRDIQVLIRHQARDERLPIVLFSHGLGGSRNGARYLADHWVARGYVTVFVQHPGSDAAIWEDVAPARRMAALRAAATAGNLIARMHDIAAVLDEIETWRRSNTPSPLAAHLDTSRIGLAGHSFGALTTQAVSGQRLPRAIRGRWPDPRIRAALPMSPSIPQKGDPGDVFAAVRIPWLVMTGTHDVSFVGHATVADRLSVYPALPAGQKYELVLEGAEHSAFSDRPLPGDRQPRNPNHHRAIAALGAAFWDAYLRGLPDAAAWLDGDGPRTVLAPGDRWQRK